MCSSSQDIYDDENVALVLVLRRDPEDLPLEMINKIKAAFPGKAVTFKRTDPVDYIEHAQMCREMKANAVILPLERPIPSKAMEEGVPHIAFLPDGSIGKLLPLVPQFEEFIP